MFLQFCYTHRIYCIDHFKHHVSGFGQYLTRVPGTRSHRGHCGVRLLAHLAACLALEYSRGLRPREPGGECVPPRDPLLFPHIPCRPCAVLEAAVALPAPPEPLPFPRSHGCSRFSQGSPSQSCPPCLSALPTFS